MRGLCCMTSVEGSFSRYSLNGFFFISQMILSVVAWWLRGGASGGASLLPGDRRKAGSSEIQLSQHSDSKGLLCLFRCCFFPGAVSFQVLFLFRCCFFSCLRRGTLPWWRLDAFPLRSWKRRLADLKSAARTDSEDMGGLRDPLGAK